MTQNSSLWCWQLSLISSLAVTGTFALSEYCAVAQIKEDSTLGTNNSIVTPILINGQQTDQIDGGATLGTNLFHSFEQFSVLTGNTAYFNNAANIDNVITRVTGKSISNIDGILRANGTANLFLINPNGIIFGPNASLNIGGSFVASTASSLSFTDGTKFSATDPQTTPLLTVSVPVGLQFGDTSGTIRNQSQASPGGTINYLEAPVGLQVQPGKTLALVGSNLVLEGGNLTAKGGRIELGSVALNSLVQIKQTDQGWDLGYESVKNFQDIQLISRTEIPSYVDVSGEGGGNILLQGRRILLTGSSQILANSLSGQLATNLTVTASDTVELIGPGTPLIVGTFSGGSAGNLTINTRKLIVSNGAQVFLDNSVSDSVAQLTVNASDSVELIGGFSFPSSASPVGNFIFSGLSSATYDVGNAGNITINTRRLSIQEGAELSTRSDGQFLFAENQFKPATGQGGNLTVNASEYIELTGTSPNGSKPSSLSASTTGTGSAGNLDITTGLLIVRNGAAINVSSEARKGVNYQGGVPNLGKAGALNITAHSILLDNKGKLTSNSESGRGGDIELQLRDLLLMRRNSQISTNAGGDGNGGNITIKAPNGFLVAAPFGNSDITANAVSGSGGKITITAKNIFGFVPRTRANVERLDPKEINPNNLRTSDITAFSQQNPSLNGTVQINSPDVDPSKGLVELPVNLVDGSQQIAADCDSGGKIARSSFIATGRGGLVADPTQPLIAEDAVLADWITLSPESQKRASGIQKKAVVQAQRNTEEKSQKANSVNEPTQIVEAQGWVTDANGNVVLVAQVPTASPHNSSLTATSCAAN
ncbi:filamentous hemagglutinin [Nostoc sp. KVJ20]|uniref:two-partner secretion domain-containing protein n=1 Tax=Nostoc sp. KVJ20 TaxID=457944 RepID=UPI00083E04B5|nr:filamentous hemagglutinin N-terminal domain-containing protein [Nostoc sp. KVJ20]ODG96398.1 filamentous hemagglutinin [Nostoc sp. KVJ20]